jgi:hypothetical protein
MSEKERQKARGGERERGRETCREVLQRKPHATLSTASKEKEGRASSNLDRPFHWDVSATRRWKEDPTPAEGGRGRS